MLRIGFAIGVFAAVGGVIAVLRARVNIARGLSTLPPEKDR